MLKKKRYNQRKSDKLNYHIHINIIINITYGTTLCDIIHIYNLDCLLPNYTYFYLIL